MGGSLKYSSRSPGFLSGFSLSVPEPLQFSNMLVLIPLYPLPQTNDKWWHSFYYLCHLPGEFSWEKTTYTGWSCFSGLFHHRSESFTLEIDLKIQSVSFRWFFSPSMKLQRNLLLLWVFPKENHSSIVKYWQWIQNRCSFQTKQTKLFWSQTSFKFFYWKEEINIHYLLRTCFSFYTYSPIYLLQGNLWRSLYSTAPPKKHKQTQKKMP